MLLIVFYSRLVYVRHVFSPIDLRLTRLSPRRSSRYPQQSPGCDLTPAELAAGDDAFRRYSFSSENRYLRRGWRARSHLQNQGKATTAQYIKGVRPWSSWASTLGAQPPEECRLQAFSGRTTLSLSAVSSRSAAEPSVSSLQHSVSARFRSLGGSQKSVTLAVYRAPAYDLSSVIDRCGPLFRQPRGHGRVSPAALTRPPFCLRSPLPDSRRFPPPPDSLPSFRSDARRV